MKTIKQKKKEKKCKHAKGSQKKNKWPVMVQRGYPLDWIWYQPGDMCLKRHVRAL